MPKSNPFLSAFNAGEFSPKMAARTDFGLYPKACEIMENMLPMPEGGATRRPGTRFVEEVKDSSVKTRLRRFEFSTTQAYIIEFGENYARFYRNQGRIIFDGTASVTNGDFVSDLSGWGDISTGSGSISHNSDGYMDLNAGGGDANVAIAEQPISTTTPGVVHGLKFRVRGRAGLKVNFRIGSTSGDGDILGDQERGIGYHVVSFTPTVGTFYIQFEFSEPVNANTVGIDEVSFSDTPVEIASPYTAAEAFEIHTTQSADTMYIFHGSHPTHKLLRFDNDNWSIEQVDFLDGPWLAINADNSKTLQPSATTGNDITITASGHSPFKAQDVGRQIRISNPASDTDYGWAIIKSVTSALEVTADVRSDFATTDASSVWRLGAWSERTGFPATGVFFEQRLTAANNENSPQNLWFSVSADFENFAPDDTLGVVSSPSALNFIISAEQVNVIQWLRPISAGLVVGTVGGEWLVNSSGAFVSPTDIAVKRHSTKGSLIGHEPVSVGESLLFIQRAGRKVVETRFSDQVNGLQPLDLTRLADHIGKGGIDEAVFAQEPNNQYWAVRNDGQLLVMTFLREEEVIAWSRQIIGGSFGTGDAVVESVAVSPAVSREEVWVTVKRTINGATKRYVEFFEVEHETGDDQEDAFFVDSGLTYSGSAVTGIAGLDHLVGETVKTWGNGAVIPDATVDNTGQIELQSAVTKAQIGLAYRHKYKPLKLDSGGSAGTAVGKTKRVFKLTMVILNSHTMEIGVDSDNLKKIDFRRVSDEMDQFVPLFTGEEAVEFEGPYEGDPRFVIEGDDPAPFTLLGIAPEIQLQDVK